MYQTSVPWTRVSWGDPAADPETGYLFVQAVNGELYAFDRNGDVAWKWQLAEDLGRFSGYGGRTNSPVVDENRLIVHSISSVWGPHKPGGDRYIAFDKKTGEILWMTDRNGPPAADLNTYSTPVVAEIGGRRLLITGGADGWIRALDARSGVDVWKFRLSQRGLNSSVIVEGDTVYASHSEENLDNAVMGRVVAIDATGSGDVTKSHERWRADGLQAGYASPTMLGDILLVPDNSANIHAYDAKTGQHLWEKNYGTVGKGSPVVADGKIFITETNGNVAILEANREGAKVLDEEHLEVPSGRYAEIYGSVAVAYDRVYFTTEEGIYCLGDKTKAFAAEPSAAARTASATKAAAPEDAVPAVLRVVPGVVVARADDSVRFRVEAFDAMGRPVAAPDEIQWSLGGLPGTISKSGELSFDDDALSGTQVGTVTARAGHLEGVAHLRVGAELPWTEDFETVEIGKAPASWLGTGKGAKVATVDGSKVLEQPKAARGAPRANILMGPSYLQDYTIQADVKGNEGGTRRSSPRTDVGIRNSGYTAELQGSHQRIQISSWTSERRMSQFFPFPWEIGPWYTLKLRVDYEGEGDAAKAIVRFKAWKRDQPEPEEWTATAEDPHPIRNGAPGLYTFAPVSAYFDNVHITANP